MNVPGNILDAFIVTGFVVKVGWTLGFSGNPAAAAKVLPPPSNDIYWYK